MRLEAFVCGKVPFPRALAWQRALIHRHKKKQDCRNYLLLLEHERCYTLGRSSTVDNFRTHEPHAPVYRTERGGEVTTHFPGQIVGYPLIHLPDLREKMSLRAALRGLEEVVIRALAEHQIDACRHSEHTGVFVDSVRGHTDKICAIGLGAARWKTYHGFALNLFDTHMGMFDDIVPCGISENEAGVTCMQSMLNDSMPQAHQVRDSLIDAFADVFNADIHVHAFEDDTSDIMKKLQLIEQALLPGERDSETQRLLLEPIKLSSTCTSTKMQDSHCIGEATSEVCLSQQSDLVSAPSFFTVSNNSQEAKPHTSVKPVNRPPKPRLTPSPSEESEDGKLTRLGARKLQNEVKFLREQARNFEEERRSFEQQLDTLRGSRKEVLDLRIRLSRANEQVEQLQQALSDANLFVHDERDRVLQLKKVLADMKIREIEQTEHIARLESISEPVTEIVRLRKNKAPQTTAKLHYSTNGVSVDTVHFPDTAVGSSRASKKPKKKTKQKKWPKGHGARVELSRFAEAARVGGRSIRLVYLPSEEEEPLKAANELLRGQLKEAEDAARERAAAFKQERELQAKEHKKHILALRDAVRKLGEEMRVAEKTRDDALNELLTVRRGQNSTVESLQAENAELRAKYDMTKEKCDEIRERTKTMRERERIGAKRDAETTLERAICSARKAREEALYLKARLQAAESAAQARVESLGSKFDKLKQKYNSVVKRRQLEVSGFARDIGVLRSQFNTIERRIAESSEHGHRIVPPHSLRKSAPARPKRLGEKKRIHASRSTLNLSHTVSEQDEAQPKSLLSSTTSDSSAEASFSFQLNGSSSLARLLGEDLPRFKRNLARVERHVVSSQRIHAHTIER
ncbi:MAG: hypothetical protein MHM6MM_000167 [Cercozoa sp. M6MM]